MLFSSQACVGIGEVVPVDGQNPLCSWDDQHRCNSWDVYIRYSTVAGFCSLHSKWGGVWKETMKCLKSAKCSYVFEATVSSHCFHKNETLKDPDVRPRFSGFVGHKLGGPEIPGLNFI